MVTRRTVFLGAGALVIVGAGAAYGVVRDMGSLDEYEGAVALTRATLRQKPEIGELLRHATLAPSGHNTQPGTFRATGDRIHVVPDLSRRTPIVDPDDHHLFVGLALQLHWRWTSESMGDHDSEVMGCLERSTAEMNRM
jgi:hypothetical protein